MAPRTGAQGENDMYTLIGILVFAVTIAVWMVLPTRIPRDK